MIYAVNRTSTIYQGAVWCVFVYFLLCLQACQPHQQVQQGQADPENIKLIMSTKEITIKKLRKLL